MTGPATEIVPVWPVPRKGAFVGMVRQQEYLAVWINQPQHVRLRRFPTLGALQAYVAEVLAVALRCQVRLRATWEPETIARVEVRLGRAD